MDAVILSNGLDTNGQNARYTKASLRWGKHDGVLRAMALGDVDLAGVVNRFVIAADKFGSLHIRSAHRAEYPFFAFPDDILWTRSNDRQIRQMAMDADVIHLNNSSMAYRRLRLPVRGKPVLLHHHGSLFRNNPKHMLDEARHLGALQAVSTVDLMHIAPEILHWAPTAYDIDELQTFGKEHRRESNERIRVVQCPTDGVNGPYKSTNALTAAVETVRRQGIDIELVIVRDKPWLEALAIKATADIYFDQVKLGYGCNAIEAWGMGIPVIAGADAWTLAKMKEMYGKLPFYAATEDSIADALTDLASSKAKRSYWATRGLSHVRKYHGELPALTRLAQLYRMAITHQAEPISVTLPPAIFKAAVPQVRAAGRFVTFIDGRVTVDNPHIATALRVLAIRRPQYGIEEVVA